MERKCVGCEDRSSLWKSDDELKEAAMEDNKRMPEDVERLDNDDLSGVGW